MAESIGKIAKRYAGAFFDLCEDTEREQATLALEELVDLWEESSELRSAMLNPAFPIAERVSALRSLCENLENKLGSKNLESLCNFLSVILENGRIAALSQITDAYKQLVEEAREIVTLEITSARPLPEAEKSAIQERVKSSCGEKASIVWLVDQELIAGLKIKTGDTVLDSSVRGALDKAREELGA